MTFCITETEYWFEYQWDEFVPQEGMPRLYEVFEGHRDDVVKYVEQLNRDNAKNHDYNDKFGEGYSVEGPCGECPFNCPGRATLESEVSNV